MKHIIVALLAILAAMATAQTPPLPDDGVYVDSAGVLRWNSTREEVSLFGVNYTTPFAYAYRAHLRLGLPLKKAVDLDVAHLSRLGLNAYRVHVWDREISDAQGNVLENDHLDLFDYLLARLADRGFKIILTPIAWWGTGWPEPDVPTRGFSQKYSKGDLITNPQAREAQRNYLAQFIRHKNPYRKLSYCDDPAVIAVEVINEPHHPDDAGQVTDYVNEMAGVLRKAGCKKPIFYNISENWNPIQAEAVARANIDGVSFQWYPTGLVHNAALGGNYLMNVNRYAIPSDSVKGYARKAKMVYEFDAADVGESIMYPAMARSFRESGMQFATMFSYDPAQIAWSNTEYPTHFLNLLYTPSKALSLMIAAKAFRQLPRGQTYGDYPDNCRFGNFRVSYWDDLCEMNSATEFIYTNGTHTTPLNAALLEHVAGCGNSAVVEYDGTGAYFLDKLEPGIWRLEVYPDALSLCDPFRGASMSRQAARLFWQPRQVAIALPDLGTGYTIRPLQGQGRIAGQLVTPGVYLVTAKSVREKQTQQYLSEKEKFLDGLFTPQAVPPGILVVNKSSRYAFVSERPVFEFQIAGEKDIKNVALYIKRAWWRGFAKHELKKAHGFSYIPADSFLIGVTGPVEYCVAVSTGDSTYTFPGAVHGNPEAWDFIPTGLWAMNILGENQALVLYNASRDRHDIVFTRPSPGMSYELDYRSGSQSDENALSVKVNFAKSEIRPFGFQLALSPTLKTLASHLGSSQRLIVRARAFAESACRIRIVLVMSNGRCVGAEAELRNKWSDHELPLSAFRETEAFILPDAYPRFLPTMWNGSTLELHGQLNLRGLESIQLMVLPPNAPGSIGVEVESLVLSP